MNPPLFSPGDLAMCIRTTEWDDITPLPGLQMMNVYQVTATHSDLYYCHGCHDVHPLNMIRIEGPNPPSSYNVFGWDEDFFTKVEPFPPEPVSLTEELPIFNTQEPETVS